MITRRGFLGSLIGSVLATDFFARLESEEWQRVNLPYRMLFKSNGYVVQAPGVAEIKQVQGGWSFVAEQLNVLQAMEIDRVILLTEQGRTIRESRFDERVHMVSGDTFHCTQTLTVNGKLCQSVEELIELHTRYGG